MEIMLQPESDNERQNFNMMFNIDQDFSMQYTSSNVVMCAANSTDQDLICRGCAIHLLKNYKN